MERVLFSGWRPFLWLALLVVAIFAPSWSFEFVELDDAMLIRENMAFLKNPRNFSKAFTQHYFKPESVWGYYYRPLVVLSFMGDAWIGGGHVWPFRLTNLFLHILAVWGVYLVLAEVLDRWGVGGRRVALWGAAVFAVHPAQAMAVAWVPGRNDQLLAIFFLTAFLEFLRYDRNRNRAALGVHLVALFFALLSKESAVTIPALCTLWCFLHHREQEVGMRLRILPWAEWLGVFLLWLLIRGTVLGIPAFLTQNSFSLGRLPLLGAFLLRYFGKALLPWDMRLIPTFSDTSPFWGFAALLLTFGAAFALRSDRYPVLLFALIWFAGLLMIAIPYKDAHDFENLALLEHRLYLPLVGLLLFWSVALAECVESRYPMLRKWGVGIAILLVAVWTALLVRRLPAFQNSEMFWTTAVRESPRSDLASQGLAVVYLESGRMEEGKRELDRNMALNPRRRYLYLNLGAYYFHRGDYVRAEEMFKKELDLYPESPFAYRHLAVLCHKQGRYHEAQQWLQRVRVMENAIETHVRTLIPDLP